MSAEWDDGPTWADPSELKESPPFSTFFAIPPSVLDALTSEMRAEGYAARYPIEVWRQRNVIVDGHTRRQAAIRAGVSEVPVFFLDFDDEASALAYMVKTQVQRRNLTEAEILRYVKTVHKPKGQGKRTDLALSQAKSGKASESTAATLGVGRDKVEKALLVASDPEATRAVEAGEKTINAAAKEVAEKKRRERKPKAPPEPVQVPEPGPVVVEDVKVEAELDVKKAVPPDYEAIGEEAGKKVGEFLRRTLDELPEEARGECVFAMTMILSPLMRKYEITLGGVAGGA
jgi:ParB-like chromosome segregation protein Spo0J